MSDHGRTGVGNGQRRPAGGRWEALLRAQISQAATNSRVSASREGHQKRQRMKSTVRWAPGWRLGGPPSRVRLGALGHPHRRFDPPCDDIYHPGRGKDGVRRRTVAWGARGEHSGKGVRPHVLGAWALGQGEIKPAEEQGPACLSWAQPLHVPNVHKVFVVRPYEDGVLGSLKPVPPLRQGGVDSQ